MDDFYVLLVLGRVSTRMTIFNIVGIILSFAMATITYFVELMSIPLQEVDIS